jgi:hypothetical protein
MSRKFRHATLIQRLQSITAGKIRQRGGFGLPFVFSGTDGLKRLRKKGKDAGAKSEALECGSLLPLLPQPARWLGIAVSTTPPCKGAIQ